MKLVRNLLALIGAAVLVAAVYAWFAFDLGTRIDQVKRLDPKAKAVYTHMMTTLLDTGDIAKATVRKVKVDKGITPDEIVDSLNSVATEMGIKPVGDLPLSKEVELRTGKKQPYTRVLSYCNPAIAIDMVKWSKAYGAYLPCRITIMQDKNGDYWLYTLDLDMMIHGGQPLPPKMLAYGNKVKKTIYTMMDKAAHGEF
ncbi:DUF302 domain-containing protein [Nitratifractor sp.]